MKKCIVKLSRADLEYILVKYLKKGDTSVQVRFDTRQRAIKGSDYRDPVEYRAEVVGVTVSWSEE